MTHNPFKLATNTGQKLIRTQYDKNHLLLHNIIYLSSRTDQNRTKTYSGITTEVKSYYNPISGEKELFSKFNSLLRNCRATSSIYCY